MIETDGKEVEGRWERILEGPGYGPDRWERGGGGEREWRGKRRVRTDEKEELF